MSAPVLLHLAILRAAALLVPRPQREEWLAEWTSELWYVARDRERQSEATAFCLGAFKDALWLRRNAPLSKPWLQSPSHCILFLAAVAVASLLITSLLPRAYNAVLPDSYADAKNLLMVAPAGQYAWPLPSVPLDKYRSLVIQRQPLFSNIAFYQPFRERVRVTPNREPELSIARASSNLLELLNIAAPATGDVALFIGRNTWRTHFGSDPQLIGRTVLVAGQQVQIAGIISEDAWRLPGRMDAWLLEGPQQLAAMPSDSKGFVVARAKSQRPSRIVVSNRDGREDRYDCESLAEGITRPWRVFLVTILYACLILPATTSLSLGEYPVSSDSALWVARNRRWLFLWAKLILVLPIVYCWMYLAWAFAPALVVVLLPGCICAFRWILVDQRRRCPVCLKSLTSPSQVGDASQDFLGWNATELICENGHGLLQIPAFPTSYFNTQRWSYLDSSWSSLLEEVVQGNAR